ncbi:hypothetical protein SCAB_64661 [Streptomyces scabiei 87.22]|uniref:Uncharacterized protein n=1 Tax=Streptomyces scabiei (strain 87.22) TaxID=680198 RepID=C9ZE37_STRSW|nr:MULTISPECIES: hypothetical protein [Streptomyces]MBP5931883.1 hypothetical protein [Streptomyces sp. LBUM 1479]MDX2551359.1 hypothetical protein [Streptomyces stelliscabiei]MDX3051132.1 hypothetical protein [Streptomyces scabiei]MDX3078730.1 hypothetical protein [Streptomyces scabiei]MDX3177544.1 hypothetical protein [Streptomyces scabiei]
MSEAMNLVQLALATFTEGTAALADPDNGTAAEERERFLQYARSHAAMTLSEAAGELVWQYVTEGLPDQVEEARAVLAPGRPDYLRYRLDHSVESVEVAFDLVQPCFACGTDRVSPVTGLFHLGELLHQEPHPDPDPAGQPGPGPLAASEALDARTWDVSRLFRRLMSRHPDAGLTISSIVCIAYAETDGSTQLEIQAASADAVREVAAGIGAEFTSRHSDTPGPYGAVVEHAKAKGRLGADIEVSVRGYTRLTDDEAAVWRAEQGQAVEAEAQTAGVGE